MGDWEFLYEMQQRGYSANDIADAAGCGVAPWEWEYVDRKWIDRQLDGVPDDDAYSIEVEKPYRSRQGFPYSIVEQTGILEDLIDCAQRHFDNTGRYLQVWGELGEIYAEVKFGLRRHRTHQAGSDGTIDGKMVEVKTISPEKSSNHVFVKNQGDFEKLLIIRIDREFNFRGRIFDRSELAGSGKFLRGRFDDE
jgi:hypothetical protein